MAKQPVVTPGPWLLGGRAVQGRGSFLCVSPSFSVLAWQPLRCLYGKHTADWPIANFSDIRIDQSFFFFYIHSLIKSCFQLLFFVRLLSVNTSTFHSRQRNKSAKARSFFFFSFLKLSSDCRTPTVALRLKTKACVQAFGWIPGRCLAQTLFWCPSDEVIRELKMYISVVQFPAVVFHLQPTSNCFPLCAAGRQHKERQSGEFLSDKSSRNKKFER